MSRQIYYKKPLKAEDYKKIAHFLKQGKTILYPTETVYGLGAKAFLKTTEKKIKFLKQRPESKPFIVLVKDLKMLEKYAFLSPKIKDFLKKWPSKTSIILFSKKLNQKVAFRISSHIFVKNLFDYIDFPIISTSANISGKKPCLSINEAKKQFQEKFKKIDIIIDWQRLKPSKPSKIIDLTIFPFKTVRK